MHSDDGASGERPRGEQPLLITRLAKYLANLGYGTRREVESMLRMGRVTHRDGARYADGDAAVHTDVLVDGEALDPSPGAVILLNKPCGFVTSLRDVNPTVYALLPSRFGRRDPVVAPVGRLDRDTSGLLLFTDDGALNHRLTSPRSHVEKVYDVTLAEPLRDNAIAAFASGTLRLDGDEAPLAPATLDRVTSTRARVTVREGRYHQIRRMFVAVGNHVHALRRVQLGPLTLDGLAEGEWRVLSATERAALSERRAP